jgi:hypothetical protein
MNYECLGATASEPGYYYPENIINRLKEQMFSAYQVDTTMHTMDIAKKLYPEIVDEGGIISDTDLRYLSPAVSQKSPILLTTNDGSASSFNAARAAMYSYYTDFPKASYDYMFIAAAVDGHKRSWYAVTSSPVYVNKLKYIRTLASTTDPIYYLKLLAFYKSAGFNLCVNGTSTPQVKMYPRGFSGDSGDGAGVPIKGFDNRDTFMYYLLIERFRNLVHFKAFNDTLTSGKNTFTSRDLPSVETNFQILNNNVEQEVKYNIGIIYNTTFDQILNDGRGTHTNIFTCQIPDDFLLIDPREYLIEQVREAYTIFRNMLANIAARLDQLKNSKVKLSTSDRPELDPFLVYNPEKSAAAGTPVFDDIAFNLTEENPDQKTITPAELPANRPVNYDIPGLDSYLNVPRTISEYSRKYVTAEGIRYSDIDFPDGTGKKKSNTLPYLAAGIALAALSYDLFQG